MLRADVLERIEQAQAMTSQALMSMPRTVMTPNTVRSTLSHLDGTCQPVAGCPRGPRPRVASAALRDTCDTSKATMQRVG